MAIVGAGKPSRIRRGTSRSRRVDLKPGVIGKGGPRALLVLGAPRHAARRPTQMVFARDGRDMILDENRARPP